MFVFANTIPANTKQADPYLANFALDYGIVSRISFVFPGGCCGLCGFKLFQGTSQVIPANVGDWIAGDGILQAFEIGILLLDRPYTLAAKYYNNDDTYNHTITIGFEITLPQKIADLYALMQLAKGVK